MIQDVFARAIVALIALTVSSPAFAEVSDKVPSVTALWLWPLIIISAASLLEAIRPRLALATLPVAAFFAWGANMEISSPDIGPAIAAELGERYLVTNHVTHAVALLGPILVMVAAHFWRRRG